MTTLNIARFFMVFAAALLAGYFVGAWYAVHPAVHTLPGEQFVPLQQMFNDKLGTAVPITMVVGVIAGIVTLFNLKNRQSSAFKLSLLTTILIAVTMISSVIVNVPINSQLQSWDINNLPSNWSELRERWGWWHGFRTILATIALASGIVSLLTLSQNTKNN